MEKKFLEYLKTSTDLNLLNMFSPHFIKLKEGTDIYSATWIAS